MEKFIPQEKLSKKEKRKLALAQRGTWNGVNPVTRKVESKKAYNRKKLRLEERDGSPNGVFLLQILFVTNKAVQGLVHSLRLNWLCKMRIHAGLPAFVDIVLKSVRCHSDNGDRFCILVA